MDPLVSPSSPVRPGRPCFDETAVAGQLARHWPRLFRDGEWHLEALDSDRDQAYFLESDSGDAYLLKIANADTEPEALILEAACAKSLAAAGLPHQALLAAEDGNLAVKFESDTGSHSARLMRWLAGGLFAYHLPHDRILHERLGESLGAMDLALGSVDRRLGERNLDWDLLQCGAAIERNLPELDGDRRSSVERILERHLALETQLKELRRQVIHGDANDHNVLVDLDGCGDPVISGFIDFGDAVTSALVNELAVAMTYAMLDTPDPLTVGAAMVAGYVKHLPLDDTELAVLFDLVQSRLALSVTMSAYQKKLEPDNDYLVVSEAPAWRLIERLQTVSARYAEIRFRAAAGLEPVSGSARVSAWLDEREDQIADVLKPERVEEGVAVVDLSAAGGLFSPGDSQEVVARRVGELLAQEQAGVGIGRYLEPRLVYLGDQFEDEDGARTVHLGIDLFAPEGEPVYAPIAGRVWSFVDNAFEYDYGPTLILQHRCKEHQLEFFTLYGHLSRGSISQLAPGQEVAAGQEIARLGAFDENGGWPPHLHLQLITDLLSDCSGPVNPPGVAHPDKLDAWTSLSPDPSLLLGPALVGATEPESRTFVSPRERVEGLRQRRSRVLAPNLSLSYDAPLEIVRGSGAYLFDSRADCYLDLVNNVCHVGHCHPRVVAAGQRQIRLLNTNSRYLHETRLEYAEALMAKLPETLEVLFLVNSGSEANDLALRLAHAATDRAGVVTLDGAYHGNLGSLVDISPYKHDGPGGAGTPAHVAKAMMPDPYRGRFAGLPPGEAALRYAQAVSAAACEISTPAGAFIAEPILSCGGQIVPPPGFFSHVYDSMRSQGRLCISDEVQVGFGRVGECFWGFELHGVVPDIVTMGKPIANGHPMGAVATTREIAEAFDNGMEYFNTFGGNPVSCAIAGAVLEVLEREELQRRALEVGGTLRQGLEELADTHSLIGDVRGHGLFLGFELVEDRETLEPAAAKAKRLVERMRCWGFLLSTDGPLHNVVKIKPPMQISEGDVHQTLAALDEVLNESALQPAGPQ